MKRIVWAFGDGSTQYTKVDPAWARTGETAESLITRIAEEVLRKGLPISPVDPSIMQLRSASEQAAYIASLGSGATARMAGVIEDVEYMDALGTMRAFREAWTHDPAAPARISCDMDKAKEIKRGELRRLRAPLLAAADVEYMRALEAKENTDEIVARKQALRDVTDDPSIDAAKTPGDLKAVLPDVLREPVKGNLDSR